MSAGLFGGRTDDERVAIASRALEPRRGFDHDAAALLRSVAGGA